MRNIVKVSFLVFLFILCGNVFGQDFGFGFGFDDDGETASDSAESGEGSGAFSGANSGDWGGVFSGVPSASGSGFSVKIGGEISVEMTPYVHDFKEESYEKAISFWDMARGKLNLTFSGSNADAYTSFNLNYESIRELWDAGSEFTKASFTPLIIDEAFLRVFLGPVNVEAGFRKLAWGKADSLGPLDVTNPLDYTDLRNISDIKAIKIARPMLHLTWNTDGFSRLEAVFIPNFAGHRFAQEGRWMPSQYSAMAELVKADIIDRLSPMMAMLPPEYVQGMYSEIGNNFSTFSFDLPNTSGLSYFQTGFRYTTTIGPADIGAQYFYGNLFQPGFTVTGIDNFVSDLVANNMPPNTPGSYTGNPALINPLIKYNRYHQIGVDYAQVLYGFNLRSELAIHITKDLSGNDGSVRNPFIGWSLGFDRELPWGINANIQLNETIRLMNGKIGNNPVLDCEADTSATSTRLTAQFSKRFMRDNLESKMTVIWDIENSGCYLIPAVVWTMGALSSELSAGIFAGKESGELGQYWANSFVRVGFKYTL